MTPPLTPRQRVRALLARQATDRPPIDIWYTGNVHDQLLHMAGTRDEAQAWRRLGIDKIKWLFVPYNGPTRPPEAPGRSVDLWGVSTAPIHAGATQLHERMYCPLQDARDADDVADYNHWPDWDAFDTQAFGREARAWAAAGFPTLGPWISLFEIFCSMRGMERALADTIEDPDLVHTALDRIEAIQTTLLDRCFAAAGDALDLVFISDDMGTQQSLLLSLETWDEFIGPRLHRWCERIHERGARVFYHSDGAIRPLIPRLITAGIDVLNPIQHRCPGMDLPGLQRDFSNQLIFHGAIDTQHVLPLGTTAEVRAETQYCLQTLSPNYIPCSCHNIQPGTPTDNIAAFLDAAGARPDLTTRIAKT